MTAVSIYDNVFFVELFFINPERLKILAQSNLICYPTGTIGMWIVDAKNGSGSVEFEGKGKNDMN